MGLRKLERDLAFIKRTMSSATRYQNIPPLAYICAGVLGLAAAVVTFVWLGAEKLHDLNQLEPADVHGMAILWGGIFIAALVGFVFFSQVNARKSNMKMWNSLASRMFLSQVPTLTVAGVLTLALTAQGQFGLIPTVWLCCYGLVMYSFSYFSDFYHQLQGALFIFLGVASCFGSGASSVILLGLGFGLLHLLFGLIRFQQRD